MAKKKEDIKKKEISDINPDDALNWLERTMQIIDKYGIVKIIEAFLIAIIAIFVVFSALHPERFLAGIDAYKAMKEKEHTELLDQRLENSPKIQIACDELLVKSNADRVLFLELHNNTGNISGLPFYFAAASCESLSDGIRPVADQYLEVKLSLFPFLTKLFNEEYWAGDMEDLKQYDKSLYYRMMSNNVHHSAFIVVQGIDRACGILIVSYEQNDKKALMHDCKEVKKELERASRKIAVLIETHK